MLRLSHSVALPSLALIGALACPSSAHACSMFYHCPLAIEGWTIPRDGATDVPTNAWIRIESIADLSCDREDCEAIAGAIHLRAVGGAEVELDRAALVYTPTHVRSGRPRTPLAPRTVYEIVDTLDGTCDVDAGRVIATFTTGDGPDEIAPPRPTLLSVGCGHDACDESSCCGPYSGTIIDVSLVPDRSSGDPDLRYELADETGRVVLGSASTALRLLRGVPPNGVGGWPWSGSSIRVRTVDIAGNTSEALHVELACPPPPDAGAGIRDATVEDDAGRSGDASIDAARDAGIDGAVADGGRAPAATSGGCACGVAPRPRVPRGVAIATAIIAVLVVSTRKRLATD